ncbi:MAG: IPTL-CTERM sorting domain-containing protein [Ottowia sp.]|uniref:delta-60 repeat domain-containing protein n=1 Tax=Ottowia sp. TaxID=1898956 RepID=UPI003C74759C
MANAAMYVPDNFADNGGTNLETMVMVKDGSGRLVIGGLFNTVEGQTGYQGVARFNADDSLDTTFKVATDEFVKAIAIQTDGKILIGGQFHYVTPAGGATTTSWGIARLNADGTVDAGFTPAPAGTVKSNHNVRGIAVQSDGKIVIGGYFTLIDGVARNRIARLNADGTLDTTFNVGTGSNGNIEDVKLQSDGKILISGSFTNIQGTDIRGVARLNTDGSLDTTFVPNGGATGVANGAWDGSFPVYQLAVQNDGKILYASGTHTYAGKYHWRMARLNTDGTPDANFNSFVNWWASSIALQNVGGEQKIVVGGDFGVAGQRNVDTNAVEGTDAQRIRVARFNADGTLDTTFDTSNSANSWLWSVLPNDDGTVYIGGKFTSVAGMARRGIARLDELDPTTQVINFQAPDPAVYSALNGSAVTWNPAPPTTSSANLPVTYSSLTPTVCTVNSTTGAVSTAVPTAVTGLCTIQADAAAGQQTINSITYDVAAAPPVQQSIQIDAPPDQSIIFPAQTSPKNVADGAFNVNPVATASSGLAVNYSSLTPTVCTVLGETVTPLTGGVCTIAANQPGGSVGAVAFNAAAQVTQSITLQSGQTIDFPAQTSGTQTIVTGSSFAIAPTATATSNLPVTYSSLTPAVCTVTGTSVQVLSSGTCTIAADQAGDTYFTPATQMSQSVQVTALPRTVAAVPTLETWALGLLATLLGVLGFRRRGSAQ